MTMKSVSVVAAACVVLLLGCKKAEEKNIATVPAAIEHDSNSSQTPYYYGLIEEYQTILAEDPTNVAATIGLGNAYLESGLWREAIRLYERALKLDARNADVHSDRGTAYRNIGMPDRALEEYRIALKYEPGHLNARYNMGIVYAFDFRNYPVAIHVWEELLRLAPNYPQSHYMRTCILTFKKNIRKEHP